jgi:hypothetical protein
MLKATGSLRGLQTTTFPFENAFETKKDALEPAHHFRCAVH